MEQVQTTAAPVREEAGLRPALERAVLPLLRWDVEKTAWAVLLLVALLVRVIGLGDRAMSHDESLHTVYSWKLYDGQGYRHDPMMHGPLKFVLNAGVYFLLGVDDWTSRIQVALFGALMVWLVWHMRGWLGKTGAFLAAAMYTISPALVYHSRYIRDEVMLTALLVLLAVTIFRYLETRATKWLVWTAVALGLAFTTMEASFIFGGLFGIYLLLAVAAQLAVQSWPGPRGRQEYRLALAVGLPLALLGVLFLAFKQEAFGIPLAVAGALALGVAAVLAAVHWRQRLHAFPELDIVVLLLTLVMPFLTAVPLKAVGWQISQFNGPGKITAILMAQGGAVLVILSAASVALGWYWLRRRWLVAAGLFWAIEVLLFTTFLTNGQGLATGLIGSLGYWIDQQEVMRGGQPWYYFYLLVPLYEFLPLLLTIAAMIAWFVRGPANGGSAGVAVRTVELAESTNGHGEEPAPRPAQRRPQAKPATVAAAGLGKAAAVAVAPAPAAPAAAVPAHFITFLIFWVIGSWITFTYVGEKMAWHVVYFTTPMALLGGWWLGQVIDGIDWPTVRARGGLWLLLAVPVFLLVLKAIFPVSERRPFAGVSTENLSDTAQWLLALVLGMLLISWGYERVATLGWRQARRLIVTALATILAVFTMSVAYRFAFVTYDYANEPMVYAHATPDIKLVMGQLEEISRKTAGDHSLRVAYDDDSTWPLEWYLRDYSKRAYYGANPSRDAMESPVVIVGDKNITKVRPYMGDRYYEFGYRLIWWPRQTYFNLTWDRIRNGILDPVQRKQFWDVVIHRRYTTPATEWDPIHRFSMFVRKDVAAQVWDWGTAPAVDAAAEDPYETTRRDLTATTQLGGVAGTGPGQMNFPRAVAVGPDGSVYVADTGNHRIQVFDADGNFVRQWGSVCKTTENRQGCQGDGRGQFNEPWSIAIGADGSVYVSDTWNHRIQKFDKDGNFITMWGVFESTNGELGKALAFYGPRSVVIGLDGNLYVMDTGNKRVQVFRPDGTFVTQYGGGGVVDGRFDEPVGLAQDATGAWYVGDTWNHRIQKFDKSFAFQAQWPVNTWLSQNVTNKPFLAVDSERGLLYATDPEGYRVLVFGLDGSVRGTWGAYGNDQSSFSLPTGIAVGPDGRVYVADGDAQRVLIFPPFQ